MKKWLVILLILILALVGRTLHRAGSFSSVTNHFNGKIEKVYTSMPGPEDLDIDYEKGIIFISSSDRWSRDKGMPTAGDGIYILNPNGSAEPHLLPTTLATEFHPHGISYLKKDSIALLFAINHNQQGNFVEIFELRNDTLVHRKSISDPTMCCPNDLVAVDEDKFYVTNDHGSPKGLMRTLEDYLLIPRSYLLYYDGAGFSKAYTGVNYGNGVAVTHDGSKLYLTTTTGRSLLTFDRDIQSGKLELVNELDLKSGIDNVTVDKDGNLWIGSHPKLLAFVGHAKDPSKHSPSQVFKLVPSADGQFTVDEIYMNDGAELSGSSVALHYKNELFIGVVFESKLVRATLE